MLNLAFHFLLVSAADPQIVEALKIEKDNPQESQLQFEKIPPSHTDLKVAAEEQIKLQYRLQNWPRFFGWAQYYRKRWPLKERKDVQILELLALLRHCQSDLVTQLASFYKTEKPELKDTMDQILALSNTRFKGKTSTGKSLKLFGSHLEGETLWKLENKKWLNVDPRLLRVKVENLCP